MSVFVGQTLIRHAPAPLLVNFEVENANSNMSEIVTENANQKSAQVAASNMLFFQEDGRGRFDTV